MSDTHYALEFVTQSGQQYTISDLGVVRPATWHGAPWQAFIGISLHKWSQSPTHTLEGLQECPQLMTGAWLWTMQDGRAVRWSDRIKAGWRGSIITPANPANL